MESSPGDPRKKKKTPTPTKKGNEAEVLSPICDNTIPTPAATLPSDEDKGVGVGVAVKKPDFIKTVYTIEELNDALQTYLLLHPNSEAIFNYKGPETIEEIVAALFVLKHRQISAMDEENERLYGKLMKDLREVGYDQENTPPLRRTPPFKSTEDLINCLLDVDDAPTPSSQKSILVAETSPLKSSSSTGPGPKRRVSSGTLSEPKSPFTELLERTGGDIIGVDPASFDDILHLEEESAMDLDQVEGADLLRPPSATASSRNQRKKTLMDLEETKGDTDGGGDSFHSHSADTTLSTSPTHFLPKNKDNGLMSSFDSTSSSGEPGSNPDAATLDDVDGKKTRKATLKKVVAEVELNVGPDLSEDELELMKRFKLSPCSIRIENLHKKQGMKELTEPNSEDVEVEIVTTSPISPIPNKLARKRRTSKGSSSTSTSSTTRRRSPRKSAPTWKKVQSIAAMADKAKITPTADKETSVPLRNLSEDLLNKEVVVGVGTRAQSSTGKTRIKARKPTEEELLRATAASLTPEQFILNRLASSPCTSGQNDAVKKIPYHTMFGARRKTEPGDVQPKHSIPLQPMDPKNSKSNNSQQQDQMQTDSEVNTSHSTTIAATASASATRETEDSIHAQDENDAPESPDNSEVNITIESALAATTAVRSSPPPTSTPPPPAVAVASPSNVPFISELSVTPSSNPNAIPSPVSNSNVAVASGTSSRARATSIEEELDDLLGIIPIFDVDLDLPLPRFFGLDDPVSLGDTEFVDVENFSDPPQPDPTIQDDPPNNNNNKEGQGQEELEPSTSTTSTSACDNDTGLEIPINQTPCSSHTKTETLVTQPESPVEVNSSKPKSNVFSTKKSATKPGPKSRKKKSLEESFEEDLQISAAPAAASNPEKVSPPKNPTKRRKVSPTSSSSGSEAYLPLVDTHTKDRSSSKEQESSGTDSPPTPEKVVFIDVDEDVSSSSVSGSESDFSDADVEDLGDLLKILPPKPFEKMSVMEMQEEWGQKNPNESRLKELMNEISSYRRRYLEADNYDIDHGMKVFPGLKNYKIVKAEYNELNPEVSGRMAKLEKELTDSLNNATNVKKRPGQKRHPLWERALQAAKNGKSLSAGTKRVLGMICLSFHLAENHAATNLLLVRKRGEPLDWQSISTPRIVMFEDEVESEEATSMYIYAEGLKHIKIPNVYEGVLTVYSLHYVFSVEYLPTLRPLFKHFDNLAKIKT